jgi:hypothetical protein
MRTLLFVSLLGLSLAAAAQEPAKECRNFDENSLRYNAALKDYNDHKISYKDFLKISEKTRLSLKGCIVKDKDRMNDQEYYGKLYINGLFLMNNGMYDDALSFFEQVGFTDINKTRNLSLSGKSLAGLAKEKKELCKKLKSSVEQGKYIYATVWFRGKGSYMAAILSDKMYKNEVSESLEMHPYFDFEIDQLKTGVFRIADSVAALKHFANAYGRFNNDLQVDYLNWKIRCKPFKARWDSLKKELNDFNEANRLDTTMYKIRKIQIDNTDHSFDGEFSYLMQEANFSQQLRTPLLFIPGPAYFDLFKSMIKEQYQPSFGGGNFTGYALQDVNFPKNLAEKTKKAFDDFFTANKELEGKTVYNYLNGLYADQKQTGRRINDPAYVNDFRDEVNTASVFYKFLLSYLSVEKPGTDIIPVYLCGKNLLPEDYHSYSDFNRDVTFRYAAGKPGSYNAPANSVLYWAASGPGTLNHELTHTVIAADFPGIPYWLNEGIASMFEETNFNYKTGAAHQDELESVSILSNFRLNYLTAFYDKFHRDISIRDIVSNKTYDQEIVNSIKDAYDRYFCYFLHDRKYLSPFYQALRKTGPYDPETQLRVLASVTGKSLAGLDKEWNKWLDHFDGSNGKIVNGSYETYQKEHPDTTTHFQQPVITSLPAATTGNQQQTQQQVQRPIQPPGNHRQQLQKQQAQDSGGFDDFLDGIGSIFRSDPKKSTAAYRITREVNALSAYPFDKPADNK